MQSTVYLMFWTGIALFFMGIIGIIIRSNLLAMIMHMELMLNGINLALIAAGIGHNNFDGAVLTFMIFIVSAAEMAVAIPIVLLLLKEKRSLDVTNYATLKG